MVILGIYPTVKLIVTRCFLSCGSFVVPCRSFVFLVVLCDTENLKLLTDKQFDFDELFANEKLYVDAELRRRSDTPHSSSLPSFLSFSSSAGAELLWNFPGLLLSATNLRACHLTQNNIKQGFALTKDQQGTPVKLTCTKIQALL